MRLIAGETLTRSDAHGIMLGVTQQRYNNEQVAALLMALQTRGIAVDELLGFRDGLLETGKSVNLGDCDVIDIVGTGGDGKNTFNISTCAAFVIAGAGYKVAKHGNFGSTSVSGASNVLQALGAVFTDDDSHLRESLDRSGICYLHAPLFAYGMKFVAPVRKALAVPTCFNLLGPLVNPCRPKHSLHGTATLAQLRLYASAHEAIGDSYGILCSCDGYDEASLTADFRFVAQRRERIFSPEELGFQRVKPEELSGGKTVGEAKSIFLSVLEGRATKAQTSVVIANAACAISVAERNREMPACIDLAKESLSSGKAFEAFRKFIESNK